MALLQVEDLSIGYQTRKGLLKAVDGISFTLDQGRSMGFVGESGCGKTTVGKALLGLLPENATITKGRILFDGEDLLKMTDAEIRHIRWKKIAMIFQAAMNALNPVHRVADQIVEAITVHAPGLSDKAAMKQVEDLFELVKIPKRRMRDFPHQYSGGMKQRAIIAMALACRPKLIIADEPTTALDVIVQDQILEEIKNLQQEFNLSIAFISHDISVVADVCHNIGVMYAGQLVEYGVREEVFESPAHPYTKALVSSHFALMGEKSLPQTVLASAPDLIHPPSGCRFCDRCPGASTSCKIDEPVWIEITPTHKVLCCLAGDTGSM